MANALSITVDANFTHYFDRSKLPVRDGLLGEYYFGGTEAASIKNWADTSKPLTAHGAITYEAGRAAFTAGPAGFTTGINETTEMTVFLVHQKPAAGTASLFSNFGTGAGPGDSTGLIQGSTTSATMRVDSADTDASPTATISQPGTANVGAMMGRIRSISGGYEGKIRYVSSAIDHENTVENTFARQFTSPFSMSIGYANGSTAYNTMIYAHAAAIYGRALSDAEISQVMNYFKQLGIA